MTVPDPHDLDACRLHEQEERLKQARRYRAHDLRGWLSLLTWLALLVALAAFSAPAVLHNLSKIF